MGRHAEADPGTEHDAGAGGGDDRQGQGERHGLSPAGPADGSAVTASADVELTWSLAAGTVP
jgi:hypothetical protein